jgi:hypothetical protein
MELAVLAKQRAMCLALYLKQKKVFTCVATARRWHRRRY